MKRKSLSRVAFSLAAAAALGLGSQAAWAVNFKIDPTHSFVSFKIYHLGYSVMVGTFNAVEGAFSVDPASPNDAKLDVNIKTGSVDTNHAERDKHIRSADFLDADKYPEATFTSTKFTGDGNTGTVEGSLTLHGVTKPVTLQYEKIAEGDDPWGGYRSGYRATTKLTRADYGMTKSLGPKSDTMDLELFIEGIREK